VSTELWQRARELFAKVVELPAGEQSDALHRQCGGNAELLAAATRLLDKHAQRSKGSSLLSAGEVIEKRFRVRRLVGRGGMGEVYLCDDIELGQPVALKALRAEGAGGAETAVRFRREIQLARRVTHPNVCRVFELGRHPSDAGQIDYYTMEYVDGETLAEMLERRGRLSPEDARPILEQIAAGLEALHEREIIHRDLKPGNVLLERRPSGRLRVVLTDFGIAGTTGRQAEADSFVTVGGQILGTPEYMAPEQLAGVAAGPATDLFALGVTLYETLTGERPFPNDSYRTATPIAPRTHNPEIPPSWEALILDCLQPEITKRPQSVDAVFEALGGRRQRGFDPSTAPTITLPARRRKSFVWLAWAGALAAALALVWMGSRLPEAKPEGRRVAVMPFVTASSDRELQVLADGLTDTVTSRLSQYEGLNEQFLVVPASEVRKVGVQSASTAQGALGVNYAVEGHIAAQDDRIRLTLTVIDTERMVQQETAVINGSRARALDLEDEAVAKLATLLDLHALPEQVESIASVSPGAEEFYLQGKGYIQRSDDLASVNNAIQLFEKSVTLDPNYARAYAGLSQAHLYKHDRTMDPAWITKAAEAARRAVELNPELLEAQTALGNALLALGEPETALRQFEAALALSPRSEEAYAGLAKSYAESANAAPTEQEKQKKRKEAEAAYYKAISLRPNDWVAYKRLGLFYYETGRLEDAIKQYQIVTDLAPDNAHAYNNLGVFCVLLGRRAESRAHFEKALELDPNRVSAMTGLGKLLSDAGDLAAAAAYYERAVEKDPNHQTAWANLGACYKSLNRHEDAEQAYRRAIDIVIERMRVQGESDLNNALLAHHFAGLGDFEKARSYAGKAVASDNSRVQLNLAIAYSQAGDDEDARAAVRRALAAGETMDEIKRIKSLERLLPDSIR
jgi:tetratricopeptide (TPR) repeat protein